VAEPQYPTLEEFWERASRRGLEPDLVERLRGRLDREQRPVVRIGDEQTVVAVADRLLPGAVPAKALAAFLDEHFDQQLGRGDERVGVLPTPELLPAGFRALDDAARSRHGRPFSQLGSEEQDSLLQAAERGEIQDGDDFDSSVWFKRVLQLLLLGYGSDPRGMIEMGFPGPSYQPGHVWLDRREVKARPARKRGYLTL
jgi:hypothetical protein